MDDAIYRAGVQHEAEKVAESAAPRGAGPGLDAATIRRAAEALAIHTRGRVMGELKIVGDLREIADRMERDAEELAGLRACAGSLTFNETVAERDRANAEIKRLEEQSRRYYHADGSFELLPTAEDVIERRKQAAKDLEALRADRGRLDWMERPEKRQPAIRHERAFPDDMSRWVIEGVHKGTTLREAIDSAMRGEKGAGHAG